MLSRGLFDCQEILHFCIFVSASVWSGLLRLCREQPRHPAFGQGRREGKSQRSAGTFGDEHFLFKHRRNDPPGLAFAVAGYCTGIAAWQLPAIEDHFEDAAGF